MCIRDSLIVVATETFSQRNQGMSVHESLRGTEKMVERAIAGGLSVSVTIGASFGCPFEGEVSTKQVMDIVTAVDRLGVDEIALADTIGVGTPPVSYTHLDVYKRQVAYSTGTSPSSSCNTRTPIS